MVGYVLRLAILMIGFDGWEAFGFLVSRNDSIKIGSVKRGRARLRMLRRMWRHAVQMAIAAAKLMAYRVNLCAHILLTAVPEEVGTVTRRRAVAHEVMRPRVKRRKRR